MSGPRLSVARVGAVAVLVVLAGCGGFLPVGDESGTADGSGDSLTPAPVPDRSGGAGPADPGAAGTRGPGGQHRSATPVAYPPGIGPDGITNLSALRAAHRAVLAGDSFRVTAVRSFTRSDREPIRRAALVANASTYAVTAGRNGTLLTYVDPTGRYARGFDRVDGRIVNVTDRATTVSLPTTPPVDAGFRFLATGDATVTRVHRNGTVLFRVFVADGASLRSLRGDYSVTAYVRPDGLVQTVVADATDPGVGDAYVERYTYTGIGTTTVTEPDWVRRAKRNRTGTPE